MPMAASQLVRQARARHAAPAPLRGCRPSGPRTALTTGPIRIVLGARQIPMPLVPGIRPPARPARIAPVHSGDLGPAPAAARRRDLLRVQERRSRRGGRGRIGNGALGTLRTSHAPTLPAPLGAAARIRAPRDGHRAGPRPTRVQPPTTAKCGREPADTAPGLPTPPGPRRTVQHAHALRRARRPPNHHRAGAGPGPPTCACPPGRARHGPSSGRPAAGPAPGRATCPSDP